MHARSKSRFRVVGALSSAVVALLLALVALLHVSSVLSWAGNVAVEASNESLAGRLQIERVSGSPFGELQFENVVLTTPDGERVLAVERVTADVSLVDLVDRGVVVDARLSGGYVFLRRRADGEVNLSQALASRSPDEPSSPQIPVWLDLHVNVADSTVVWRDETVEASVDDALEAIGATTERAVVSALTNKVVASAGTTVPRTVVLDEVASDVRIVVQRDQHTTVAVQATKLSIAAHPWTTPRAVVLDDLLLSTKPDGTLTVELGSADFGDWGALSTASLRVPIDVTQLSASVDSIDLSRELIERFAPDAGLRVGVAVSLEMAPAAGATQYRAVVRGEELRPFTVAGAISGWDEPGPKTRWSASVRTRELVPGDFTAIAAPIKRLDAAIEVDGQGIDPETLTATARVTVQRLEVDRYRIDSAYASLGFSEGVLRVDRSFVQSPYGSVAANVRWGLDGSFELHSRTEASEDVERLARELFQRNVSTRANVRFDATGRVDLERDDPAQMLRELDATVDWEIDSFVAEDVQIKRSTAKLRAVVETDADHTEIELRGRVTGRGVKSAGTSVSAFDADIRADSRVTTADPTTMEVIRGLTARLDLDVRGLDSAGALVRDVDVIVQVKPQSGGLRYEVRGSAARVAAGSLTVRDAGAKLKGKIDLGTTLEWPGALRAIEARGSVAARGVDASGDAASAIEADIDIGGPITNLKGKIAAKTSGLEIAGYSFTSLKADVDFIGDRLFVVNADGLQKERTPEQLGVYMKGRYNRALDDFEVLELRFSSTGEAWSLTDGFSVDTKSGTVRFNDVTLTHEDQRINVKGTLRQGKDQDLEVDIEGLDIASVARDFGITGLEELRGKLSADAEVRGTHDEPVARFSIHLTDLYWQDYGPFELRAEGRYAELALVVESLELDGYDVRLLEGHATLPLRVNASGDLAVLRENPIEAFLETPEFDPVKLHPAVPLLAEWAVVGRLSAKTNLRGSLQSPKLNVDVRAKNLTAAAIVDEDRLEVGPINGTLALRYDNPRSQNGGFELSLNAAWADEPPIQLLARVKADVASWLAASLDGTEVDWTDRLMTAPWRFIGHAKRFDLRNVRIGKLREADIEGFVTVSIIGDGTLADPQANFELKLADFGWNRYRDIFIDANLGVEGDRVILKSSRLEWDGDEIAVAQGTIPVPFATLFGEGSLSKVPIDFRAQLQPMKLAKLSAMDYSFAALKGTARGFAQFNGTLLAPVIEAQLAVDELQFADRSIGGVSIDASLNAADQLHGRIRWTREGVQTLQAIVDAPLHVDFIRLAGGEALDLGGEFRARIESEKVPLAGLIPNRIFDDTVRDVRGTLSTDLTVVGTLDAPTLDGHVRLSNAAFTLTGVSRQFENVQLDLTADPKGAIALHDLHVEGERGRIDAVGSLQLVGWKPGLVDGKIEVREFGTSGFSEAAMFVWADVRLDGDFAAEPASAKATISNVEVVVPNTADLESHPTGLDEDIVIIRNDRDRQALYAVEATIEPVSSIPYAKLAIEVENGARIRHPLAEVEIGGDLTLELSEAGPILSGEIQSRRGSAQFLGKRFAIQQAIVTFTGSDPPDPRLQVEAAHALDRSITRSIGQATSGEPRAIVRVTGRASDPRIRFLSDPAMSESDVIYVLLTNRPPGEGEVGETGLASGAGAGLLTGLIADSPVGKVIDVRVEAGQQGFEDVTVEVGRYITRNLFISVDIQRSPQPDENDYELNIEYRFAPRWIFELEAGNRSPGAANVFWDIY